MIRFAFQNYHPSYNMEWVKKKGAKTGESQRPETREEICVS